MYYNQPAFVSTEDIISVHYMYLNEYSHLKYDTSSGQVFTVDREGELLVGTVVEDEGIFILEEFLEGVIDFPSLKAISRLLELEGF